MKPFQSRRAGGPSPARAVHQLVPRLAWGDAVGNQVRYLRELLRSWGYASEIYADQWDEECRSQVRPASDYAREAGPDTALLIHHSYASRLVPLVQRAPGRKALIYHNVTPARLFEGFDRLVAAGCAEARDELRALRPLVECAYAYSHFSAEELGAADFPHVRVLPFAVDWRSFHAPADPALKAELDDGCTNVLFVGRAVPSKRVDDVLRVFTAYQRLYQPRSRLVLAGYLNRDTPYGAYLFGVKELLGAERVHVLGRVSAAQLSACYATATVYLSMSRHEGYGVPLLEAMAREVPVVAYGAAAVPETMGGAGIATRSNEPGDVARLLAVLDRRPDLRGRLVEAQSARLSQLSQQVVAEQLRTALAPFLDGRHVPRPAPAHAPARVDLVCPGWARQGPPAHLARALARHLPGARVLALRPPEEQAGLAPRLEQAGALEVWHFAPDEPYRLDSEEPLPGSSSLEMAVRTGSAPVVFLDVESTVARETLSFVQARAWGVRDASLTSPAAPWIQALGKRLLPLDIPQLESTARLLADGLGSRGVRHAG